MKLVEHTELQLAEIMLGHLLEAHNIALTLEASIQVPVKEARRLVADWRGRRGHEEDVS